MNETIQIFATIATAIVVEAAPFLALGALFSALFQLTGAGAMLGRRLPRGPLGQVGAGLVAGMLLPTCECGVVPVVRGMLASGVPARTALAYMLAAPVVNPVVMVSTWVAFRGDASMLAARVGLVAAVAGGMALVLGRLPISDLLRGGALTASSEGCGCGHEQCDHDHDHAHGHGHEHDAPAQPQGSLVRRLIARAGSEFLDMGAYLILGAVVAAAYKTWVPAGVSAALGSTLLGGVTLMSVLAVLLSVCSEADAFVAAAFVNVPWAGKLAFVALGPMLDLKLAAMFYGAFKPRVATALVVVPAVAVWTACMALGALGVGS